MRVWIDADACPRLARDQVVKFALKRGFEVVLVAGQAVARPNFTCVKLVVVPSGPDAADDHLVEHAVPGELVAGQSQVKPSYALVKLIVVPSGPDAADDYLVEHAVPGELVICSDIPLADRLVKKGVAALDPRGREFDERNMGERLAIRNLFTDLREQGQMGGGQAAYSDKDRQAFANSLDRILTRLMR